MIGAGGPKILATQIGEDYAVIDWRGQTEVLKLADHGGRHRAPVTRAAANDAHRIRSPKPPARRFHGGGTDPYAGIGRGIINGPICHD